MKDDDFSTCYKEAVHFLGFRQRSEAELKDYLLNKRKHGGAAVTAVLAKLKELKLVDDRVFALNWVHDRVTLKHKSSMVIRHELLQKGIDAEIVDRAIAGIDDDANALKAGIKRARLLGNTDYAEFRRRLAAYLGRRGFSGGAVHRAIQILWETVKRENPGK
jgi:regulatory protein